MKTKWYLANIIEFPIVRDRKTLKIINKKKCIYWDNLVLIKAINSEKAYKKALDYGKTGEYPFTNTNGDYVEWKFAGIRELVEVYNPLEDGEELAYSEETANSFTDIRKIIPSKSKLGVFEWERKMARRKPKKKIKTKIKLSSEQLTKSLRENTKRISEILGNLNKNI